MRPPWVSLRDWFGNKKISRPQRVSSPWNAQLLVSLLHHDWKTRRFLLLFSLQGTEDENPDYHVLKKGERAQSMFICRSCNANPDYQRLSRQGHCPHEGNQEREEKSRSLYASLTTERGARESVYMNPSHTDEVRIFLFSFRPFFYWFLRVQINWWPRKKSAAGPVSCIVRYITDFGTNGPIRFSTGPSQYSGSWNNWVVHVSPFIWSDICQWIDW